MNEVTLEFVLVPVPITDKHICTGCIAFNSQGSTHLCQILPDCDTDQHIIAPGHTTVWKAKKEYE